MPPALAKTEGEHRIADKAPCVTEVRPLRLHDLPFAYRMVGQGVSFDAQLSLTVGEDSLRPALLTSSGRMQAYVLRQSGGSALGQLHFLAGEQLARLAYIAPALDEGHNGELLLCLLEGLAIMAGQRGVVTILAEVDDTAPEFEVLRRASFVTYAYQELWVRPPAPAEPSSYSLRAANSGEDHGLLGLYGSLVPGLIKHVEPPPTGADVCFVLDGPRGAAGIVIAYQGGQATLMEAYLAPEAGLSPRAFLSAALAKVQANKRTVYFRLRDYMGCTPSALADSGFRHLASQAALFRHTAARVTHPSYQLKEKVDGGVPLPTSIVDVGDELSTNFPSGRRVETG